MIRSALISFGTTILALSIATPPATARDEARTPAVAQFAVAAPAALAGLAAVHGDERFGTPRAIAVTDLRLILSHARSGLERAMRLANGLRPGRDEVLFRAQIIAVSGGRLWTHGSGWCSHWRDDRAFCEVDCEGGAFEIERSGNTARGGALRLSLVLDPARIIATGAQPGVAFSACAPAGQGGATRLRPARHDRAVAIPLRFDTGND